MAAPINLVGTGDGLEIFSALAKAFAEAYPGEEVLVPASIGSGGAIAAVGAGRERIGRVARALTPVERASGLVDQPVFEIPSAFYVHPGVGPRALSVKQLAGIFSGHITSWKAVGGPDLRVRVVKREESDSTLTVLRASLPAFRELVMTERSKTALTTQDAINSIRENEGAIGFGPYSVKDAALLGVVALDGLEPGAPGYPAKVRVAVIWHEARRDAGMDRFLAFLATPAAAGVIASFGAIPVRK